jgi:DNA-directed RNA polymerase specialized sigma24 family protein
MAAAIAWLAATPAVTREELMITREPEVKTRIGQDSQIDEELVLALLLDYRVAPQDSKQRHNARNTVVTALLPTVDRMAKKFGDHHREDLYQDGVEKLFELIDKWDPNKEGTIGGYVRTALQNFYTTMATKAQKRDLQIAPYPFEDLEEILESRPEFSEDLNIIIAQLKKSVPGFLEGEELKAYYHALSWFLDLQHEAESLRALTMELTTRYGVSVRRSIHLASHAKVSIRMILGTRVPAPDVEEVLTQTPDDSMFLRMVNWLCLPDDTVTEMLKVFGGTEIHVPRGY